MIAFVFFIESSRTFHNFANHSTPLQFQLLLTSDIIILMIGGVLVLFLL